MKSKKSNKPKKDNLKIALYIFTIFGIIGVISGFSPFDIWMILFYVVWTLLGILCLYLYHKWKIFKESKAIQKPTDTFPSLKHISSAQKTTDILPNPKSNSHRPSVSIPVVQGESTLVYRYPKQPVFDLNYNNAMILAEEQKWELTAKKSENDILLYGHDDIFVGKLGGNRVEMLSDWLMRNEPYIILLENVNTESKEAVVFLGFYRDFNKYYADRESSIVKLTRYQNETAQLSILAFKQYEKLELDEYDDKINVDDIGWLSGKIAQRLIDNGYSACVFDHYDYDDEKDVYIPYVKIFW